MKPSIPLTHVLYTPRCTSVLALFLTVCVCLFTDASPWLLGQLHLLGDRASGIHLHQHNAESRLGRRIREKIFPSRPHQRFSRVSRNETKSQVYLTFILHLIDDETMYEFVRPKVRDTLNHHQIKFLWSEEFIIDFSFAISQNYQEIICYWCISTYRHSVLKH